MTSTQGASDGARRHRRPLEGKVAVVTGGASGIGRATAELLAEKGARIHLVDFDSAKLETTAAEMRAAGAMVVAHRVDVADPAQVERLAATVFEAEGAVDVLHNNAGIGVGGPFVELTLEDIQRTIHINLLGTAYGIHYFLPRMLRQGRHGHIVNTASGAGLVPIPMLGIYSASKHGVVALTEALDTEMAHEDISFSVICPGVIDTPILRNSPQRGGLVDVDRIDRLAKRFAATPRTVAESVWHALETRELVVVSAPIFVTPAWLIRRLSPRASRIAQRLTAGVFARRLGR